MVRSTTGGDEAAMGRRRAAKRRRRLGGERRLRGGDGRHRGEKAAHEPIWSEQVRTPKCTHCLGNVALGWSAPPPACAPSVFVRILLNSWMHFGSNEIRKGFAPGRRPPLRPTTYYLLPTTY